jgi:hypothetical protein
VVRRRGSGRAAVEAVWCSGRDEEGEGQRIREGKEGHKGEDCLYPHEMHVSYLACAVFSTPV